MKKWVAHGVWASCLLVATFPWHKKGFCKTLSTSLWKELSQGRGVHARIREFPKVRARTREMWEWERREKGGRFSFRRMKRPWRKKSKEWFGWGIGLLPGLFSAALHLSHSYWRKATAATSEHEAEELLWGQKNIIDTEACLSEGLSCTSHSVLCNKRLVTRCMV